MRYAISYLSTANPLLTKEDIITLLTSTKEWNNQWGITGILIYSDGNFFQFIEGEEEIILKLFSKIELDQRHYNLIRFIGTSVYKPSSPGGYVCEFKDELSVYNEVQIKQYHNCFQVLNQSSKQAAIGVMDNILK